MATTTFVTGMPAKKRASSIARFAASSVFERTFLYTRMALMVPTR